MFGWWAKRSVPTLKICRTNPIDDGNTSPNGQAIAHTEALNLLKSGAKQSLLTPTLVEDNPIIVGEVFDMK